MKKLLLCILTLTALGASAQITDLPVTANPTEVCSGGSSSTISTTGSQTGVNYSLRNSSNTVIAGPIAGTGSNIDFNTGALSNSETFNVFAEPYAQSSLIFDGVDDVVNLTAHNRGMGGNVTVSCWVKTTASGATQYIVSKYDGASGYRLYMDANGKVVFDARKTSGNYIASGLSTVSVNDGNWHYITGTAGFNFGGYGYVKILVDGVLQSQNFTPMGGTTYASTADLIVGAYNNSGFFTGEIDEVSIMNIYSTDPAALGNYTTCLTGSEIGGVGYFNFNEGTGTTVTDLSPILANGALTNMGLSSWTAQSLSACFVASSPMQMTQTATVNILTINDENVSGPASVCSGSSATVSTGSSVAGIDYTLKDGNGNIIDGPTAGTGSALNFSTGNITSSTTYSVYGKKASAPSVGNALAFDGINDYVNLTNLNRGISNQITVGCWVKTTVAGSSQFLVSKYNGSSGYFLAMSTSGKALFDGKAFGGSYTSSGPSTTSINDGQWHYVVGTTTIGAGGSWKIYVDGVWESGSGGATTGSGLGNSSILTIGAYNTNFSNLEIDDVSIWNTDLTVSDIQSNMNNCLTGTETNLVGLFDFNDDNTAVLIDYSPSANNGILTNMDPLTDWVASTASGCSPGGSCSLTMTQTATISIDNSAPVPNIASLLDVTSQCPVTSLTAPTATDVCSGAIVGTHNATLPITANTTITWTYDDGDGNTIMQNQNVMVNDNTAPTAIAQNITLQLDVFGAATITAATINNGSTDNCTAVGNLILSLDRTLFVCADIGPNAVILTIEDADGNIGTANATVTVEDNVTPAVITQDITVSVEGVPSISIAPQQIDNGSSDACGILSYSLDIDTFTSADVGANTVALTVTDVNGNMNTGTATVTVTQKQAQTITFDALSVKTYGDAFFQLAATASSGLAVSYGVVSGPATIYGSDLYITGVGNVVIEAAQAGDATFVAATPVQQSFNVAQAALTVTADNQTITYGDAFPTLTFTYAGFVNAEDATALTTQPTTATGSSNAGSYPITLSGGVASNYTFTLLDGSLVINKAGQTLSIDPIADQDFTTVNQVTVTASSSAGLTTGLSVTGPATISGSLITLDGTSGTVTVTASQAGNTNYNPAADVSTTFEAFDGTDPCLTFAVSLVSTSNNTCNGAVEGSINITATGGDGNFTYNWSNGTGSEDATLLAAGTYTVTVTDGNSCSVTVTETITEPTFIEITATTTGVVAGDDGAADITITGRGIHL